MQPESESKAAKLKAMPFGLSGVTASRLTCRITRGALRAPSGACGRWTPALSSRMAEAKPDTFAKDNGLSLLTIMSGLSVRTLQRLSGPDAQMAAVLPFRRAMRSDLRQVGSLCV